MILTDILESSSKKFSNKYAFTMRMGYRKVNLTYQQVYDLSIKIALFLKKNGIEKGDKVLIFAPNSPYWGSLFWGTIFSGAIAVPLNVQSTQDLVSKIVAQTEGKIFFKSKYFKIDLPSNVKVYDIEFLDELVADFNLAEFKKPLIDENDVIEILYTSGTTGDPKGVLLTHKNIVSNIEAISEIFKFNYSEERVLSILPLTHILEQTIGFFLPILYGAYIIYAHSYAAIADLLCEYRITKMVAVPEFLKIFISKIKAQFESKGLLKVFECMLNYSGKINNKHISRFIFYPVLKKMGGCLDTVASGGAFLDPEIEKEWNALGIDLIQGYGLTETSPVITCNSYDFHKFGSVGKKVKGVDIKFGNDGQILVKGESVFSGYFRNEEKTKESFTSDGWFKTGDIAYIDKDGFVFLKGRKKYVIIGPGAQNVFPEDIELELNKVAGVKDSCVIGLEKIHGMVEIHAVLLLENDSYNIEAIVQQANKRLATYQQITGYSVWLDSDFPRSATRKVKKEDVIKDVLARDGHTGYITKNGMQKDNLIKILSQITGVDTSYINDETKIIQDLKLDSLMRVELVFRVELEYGSLLDESFIGLKTTVSQLRDFIKQKAPLKKVPKFQKWPRFFWAFYIRTIGQFMVFGFLGLFVRLKIEGKQNLDLQKLPVIFMPNHTSYIDPVVLLMALPFKIRKKLAFAAASDFLYREYRRISWLADLFFNSFSFPRQESENIKIGLDNMGKLLDKGFSIGVFPEGKLSLDQNFQSLRQGAGFMAVEMDAIIVPVKIIGAAKIVPYGKIFPRSRGSITIKFGTPIKFKKSDSYDLVTNQLEKLLGDL